MGGYLARSAPVALRAAHLGLCVSGVMYLVVGWLSALVVPTRSVAAVPVVFGAAVVCIANVFMKSRRGGVGRWVAVAGSLAVLAVELGTVPGVSPGGVRFIAAAIAIGAVCVGLARLMAEHAAWLARWPREGRWVLAALSWGPVLWVAVAAVV